MPPAPDATPARGVQRVDIQGLRALAVLLVVADHLWHWPRGGFVGVDVFFVISGFLITGQLLGTRAGGAIGFGDFYCRRVRRIVPAAVLVVVTTVAATFVLVSSARGHQVLDDGVWSVLFASNWHFAAAGSDYFSNDGTISPLQHFWSLAVEEQFYIVWPWLIIATLGFSAARTTSLPTRRLRLGAVTAAVILLSFGYSLWHTGVQPLWAYFSSFDRAWELSIGALLAVFRDQVARMPALLRPVLGGVGVVAIGVSAGLIDATTAVPAPGAALPVLGAAAVIAAGCGGHQRYLVPLVNPLARYVGDISYSLYLWHFPVIILGAVFFPRATFTASVVLLVVMFGLACACYHLVERPIHESTWLEPHATGTRRRGGTMWSGPARYAAVGTSCVAATVLAGVALAPGRTSAPQVDGPLPLPPATPAVQPAGAAPAGVGIRGGPPAADRLSALVAAQQRRLDQSLELRDFPDFDPPLDHLSMENWTEDLERDGCTQVREEDVDRCSFGPKSAARTAVVLGDSYAMAWMPGIRRALEPVGYRVQQLTFGQCPAWDVKVSLYLGGAGQGAPFSECPPHRQWAEGVIARMKPSLVVLATADTTVSRLLSGNTGNRAKSEIRDGLARTLSRVVPHASRTVVLAPPPMTWNLRECVTRFGGPNDCSAPVSADWRVVSAAEAAASAAGGATYIDTSPWLCSTQRSRCPGFIGSTPGRVDGQHITPQLSKQLAPLLREALQGPASGPSRGRGESPK